jgi:hypothetical protein
MDDYASAVCRLHDTLSVHQWRSDFDISSILIDLVRIVIRLRAHSFIHPALGGSHNKHNLDSRTVRKCSDWSNMQGVL